MTTEPRVLRTVDDFERWMADVRIAAASAPSPVAQAAVFAAVADVYIQWTELKARRTHARISSNGGKAAKKVSEEVRTAIRAEVAGVMAANPELSRYGICTKVLIRLNRRSDIAKRIKDPRTIADHSDDLLPPPRARHPR